MGCGASGSTAAALTTAFEYFLALARIKGARHLGEAALANPGTVWREPLIRVPSESFAEFEKIYYVAVAVFKEKGGEGDARTTSPSRRPAWAGLGQMTGEPLRKIRGALARRYPASSGERFGDSTARGDGRTCGVIRRAATLVRFWG